MERIDDNLKKISPLCDFCHLNTNSEEEHGLIRSLKTVSCHYFCLVCKFNFFDIITYLLFNRLPNFGIFFSYFQVD